MELDRVRADSELDGDLLVAPTLGDQGRVSRSDAGQIKLPGPPRDAITRCQSHRHDSAPSRHVANGRSDVLRRVALEDDSASAILDRTANRLLADLLTEHHYPRLSVRRAQRLDGAPAATGSSPSQSSRSIDERCSRPSRQEMGGGLERPQHGEPVLSRQQACGGLPQQALATHQHEGHGRAGEGEGRVEEPPDASASTGRSAAAGRPRSCGRDGG